MHEDMIVLENELKCYQFLIKILLYIFLLFFLYESQSSLIIITLKGIHRSIKKFIFSNI